MALLIRNLAIADKAAWHDLFAAYNAFYGREGETALAPIIVETSWQRFFDAYEPVHAMVAEENGQIVGFVHYLYHRSTSAIEPNCYLQDLFTIPEMRGRGVGRALIEAVYQTAREAGAGRVYWQTHESNTEARKLYDNLADNSGFIVYRKMMKD